MRDMGIIKGSSAQAKKLIVGKDTVYVHTDIVELEDGMHQYHEVQYDKDEYIELLDSQLTDTQLALCEIYELLMSN